jgi:small subunit ribosomal protein S6
MSRKYEGIVVLNTKGTEGGVEDLVSVVSKEMQAEGATITETQDMGRRKFAYNSDHMESGHYINFQFTAEPSSIEKIKGRLRLNNQIHLQYYQRAEGVLLNIFLDPLVSHCRIQALWRISTKYFC